MATGDQGYNSGTKKPVEMVEGGYYRAANGAEVGPMRYDICTNGWRSGEPPYAPGDYWFCDGSRFQNADLDLVARLQRPTPRAQPATPAKLLMHHDPRWDGSLPRIVQATTALLRELDPEPMRNGLAETPARVAKAWQFWTSGYRVDPAEVLKVFTDGAEQCDEMVVRKHVPIYSHCEHHMAPIIGEAVIAYIPDGRIVGLSKLDRLADVFARRLQVQERMTNQIAEALWQHLSPKGCGVVVKARHLCMESRGVCHVNSHTTTSALRGCFKDDARVRAEFLSLAHNGDK